MIFFKISYKKSIKNPKQCIENETFERKKFISGNNIPCWRRQRRILQSVHINIRGQRSCGPPEMAIISRKAASLAHPRLLRPETWTMLVVALCPFVAMSSGVHGRSPMSHSHTLPIYIRFRLFSVFNMLRSSADLNRVRMSVGFCRFLMFR